MIRKTTQIISFTMINQTIYRLRRRPKICNGQVDVLDSKLYPVLLTVTRPIMTTSIDSAHVNTLQVGVIAIFTILSSNLPSFLRSYHPASPLLYSYL